MTFSKVDFAAMLAATAQMTNGTFKRVSRPVAFELVFNGAASKASRNMLYTATHGKSGMAK
ncbi:MAG TPA: hypothetical protein VKX17_02760 [Planctomycetota bacterium]|nr:hypothetical protein [Planctomycetota bacterium]